MSIRRQLNRLSYHVEKAFPNTQLCVKRGINLGEMANCPKQVALLSFDQVTSGFDQRNKWEVLTLEKFLLKF